MTTAPADQKLWPRWPLWRRLLAYAVLFMVAAMAIWLVDRDAMRVNGVTAGPITQGS